MNMLHLIALLSILFSFSSCYQEKTESAITKIIYIDSYLVDCQGVGPQQCMRYREDPNGPWTLFYDSISGFDYQSGYQYQLEVRITPVTTPLADASSLHYTLIKILSKIKSVDRTPKPTIAEISYQEHSRGFYKMITVDTTTIATSKVRNQDPATTSCSKKQWSRISALINLLELQKIHSLEAPTKKHQFDGAPHAQLQIKTADTTYTSCPFDGGTPPAALKALVNQILSLGETVEKQ